MATSHPQMSMNKTIHRAVRRDLVRFRQALDAFVDGDRERAAALHRAWENFDAQLTDHHEGEHAVAWPALDAVGVTRSTLETFDAEHEAMAADLATARDAMARLSSSASRSDADDAAAALGRLQRTTVTHLDHEEAETEGLLTQRAGDPAMKTMSARFSRRSSPAKAGTFFAWVQDGASAEERTALRANVPAPVLTVLGGLFGRRYRREVAPVWHGSSGA
ncbi:Hemerythrin HHE cation binding domain-containing protein [Friedmanniella luteola]|uniref:Hemerythrin HHE cation binding domain-containing protein n=1 Tax=Friedmanniella luteola TaxID=546871 RepID=A0A1H1MIZ9_9ACTN|nr:hemerythrin domain-containing protein [Friedmanniella luteola]SDR86345.1 Hemerythrin HHE cation binding domain-containing protein [Friedmanniella luteola]